MTVFQNSFSPVGETSRSRCNMAARLSGPRRQKAPFVVGRGLSQVPLASVRARALQRSRGTGNHTTMKKRLLGP